MNAPQDYRPAAVQAAQEILAQRDPAELAVLATTVVDALDQERRTRQQAGEEPLGPRAKVLCFVFCGIPGIVFAAVQEAKGRTQRAHEAWTWVGYGWLARIGLVLLIFVLSRL